MINVLRAMLRLIHDSGMIRLSEISEKTGATEPMVEQAIALLLSKGYIERADIAQDTVISCVGCHNHCRVKQWAGKCAFFVTAKGKITPITLQ